MKVGIVCAGDKEFAPFMPSIKDCKITEKAMLKFYEGKIHGVDVVALFSGVCKVNAAIAELITLKKTVSKPQSLQKILRRLCYVKLTQSPGFVDL